MMRASLGRVPSLYKPVYYPSQHRVRSSAMMPMWSRRGAIQPVAAVRDMGAYNDERALSQQLSRARSWRDVKNVMERYKGRLEPNQVKSLMNSLSYLAPRGAAERREFEKMMKSLVKEARQCLPRYSAPDMADTAYALGKTGCMEPAFMDDLMGQALKSQLAAAKERQRASQPSLGSMMGWTSPPQPLDAAAEKKQGASEQKGVSDLLHALASVRYRPGPNILRQLLGEGGLLDQCSSPDELNEALYQLSRLGVNPGDEWIDKALGNVQMKQAQREMEEQREIQRRRMDEALWRQQLEESQRAKQQQRQQSAQAPAMASSAAPTSGLLDYASEEEAQRISAAIHTLERLGRRTQAQQLRERFVQELRSRRQSHAEEMAVEEEQQRQRSENQARAEASARAASKARAESQARAEAATRAEAETRARAAAAGRAEAETRAQAEAAARAVAETRAKAEAAARAKAEELALAAAQAEGEAEAVARSVVEAAERAKAEKVARAEAEERAKAESEAKAEAARRAHAETQARARTEAEARLQAAAEAKAKAEAEARERAWSVAQASRAAAADQREESMYTALHHSIDEARTWVQLRSLVYTYGNRMNFGHLSALLIRMPGLLQGQSLTWQARSYLGDMLEAVGGLLMQRAGEAKPMDIALTMYSLTQLGYLEERLLASLLRVAREKMALFVAADLATLVMSLAQGGLRPTSGWLDLFTSCSAKKLAYSTPEQLIATAQSFAKIGHKPGQAWLNTYLSLLETNQADYGTPTMRDAIRAAASLDMPSVQEWYTQVTAREQAKALGAQEDRSAAVAEEEEIQEVVAEDQMPSSSFSSIDMNDIKAQSSRSDNASGTEGGARETDEEGGSGQASMADLEGRGPASDMASSGGMPPQRALESVDFDIDREEVVTDSGSRGGGGLSASSQLPGGFVLPPGAVAYPWRNVSREIQKVPQVRREESELEVESKRGLSAWQRVQNAELAAANASKVASLRKSLRQRYELAKDMKQSAAEGMAAAEARRESAAVRAAPLIAQVERLMADYNNFKKRAASEQEAASIQARADVVKALLPIVDNFERGDAAIKPKTDGEALVKEGYRDMYQQLLQIITELGAEEVPGAGSPFDPTFHDAIMMEPGDGTVPDNTVLLVLQKGFCIGDTLIRPALVKVSV